MIKVGDKVVIKDWVSEAIEEIERTISYGSINRKRIYKSFRPKHWNGMGKMDKWCGQIVTIRSIGQPTIKIEEDKNDRYRGVGWSWRVEDFIPAETYLEAELFEI